MLKKLLLLSILIIIISNTLKYDLYSKTDFFKQGAFNLKLFGSGLSSSSYFDLNRKSIPKFTDNFLLDSTVSRNWGYEFNRYTIGLLGEYYLSSNFAVYVELPMSYYSLEENYEATSNYARHKRASFQLFLLDYVGIGAKYLVSNNKSFMATKIEARIPSDFRASVINDSKYKFLSPGALEVLAGFILGLKSEKYFLETEITYNFRDKELKDQLLIRTEAGISTVESTYLKVSADFVQSLSAMKDVVPYHPEKNVLQENALNVGFVFSMFFSKETYAEFGYTIRLTGQNSMNCGKYFFSVGTLFN